MSSSKSPVSKPPFFSILLPTRNHANLLELALRSILSQSFGDFEVILSDNHSRDATAALVDRLAAADPRLKVFHQSRDLFIGENWNFCYARASGEFFILLGDDDTLMPDALERVHRAILSHADADIVGLRYALIQLGPNLLLWHEGSGAVIEGSKSLFLKRAFGFVTPIEHTLAIRRSLSLGAFPQGHPYHGAYLDQPAWFRFFSCARGIYYIETVGVLLGISSGSSTVRQKDYRTRHEAFAGVFSSDVRLPFPGDYFANMQYETLELARSADPAFCVSPIDLPSYWARIGSEIDLLMLQALARLDWAGFKPLAADYLRFVRQAPLRSILSSFVFFAWGQMSALLPLQFREGTKDFVLKTMKLRRGYPFHCAKLKRTAGSLYSFEEAVEKIQGPASPASGPSPAPHKSSSVRK